MFDQSTHGQTLWDFMAFRILPPLPTVTIHLSILTWQLISFTFQQRIKAAVSRTHLFHEKLGHQQVPGMRHVSMPYKQPIFPPYKQPGKSDSWFDVLGYVGHAGHVATSVYIKVRAINTEMEETLQSPWNV